jgi:hypothetical protein
MLLLLVFFFFLKNIACSCCTYISESRISLMLGLLIVCVTVRKGGLSNRSQSQEVAVLEEGNFLFLVFLEYFLVHTA